MPGFGKLERYRYQDILGWVEESLKV